MPIHLPPTIVSLALVVLLLWGNIAVSAPVDISNVTSPDVNITSTDLFSITRPPSSSKIFQKGHRPSDPWDNERGLFIKIEMRNYREPYMSWQTASDFVKTCMNQALQIATAGGQMSVQIIPGEDYKCPWTSREKFEFPKLELNHTDSLHIKWLMLPEFFDAMTLFFDEWYASSWVPTFDIRFYPNKEGDAQFMPGIFRSDEGTETSGEKDVFAA